MNELDKSVSFRDKILTLEHFIEELPQADCPVRHYFAPGLYAREITIPQGVTLTGAIHKQQNLAILSKGRLLLATEHGPVEISAPCTLPVTVGAKNAALALEESVWTNFFPNPDNITDIDKLVELLTESKACELIGGSENKQLLMSGKEDKWLSE